MQITFHSQAADVPAFRDEVVAELKRRWELAKNDQLLSLTTKQSEYHRSRITELRSLIDFFETLRLLGDTH